MYEAFIGDTITYGGGDLALEINSQELSVDNNVTVLPRPNRSGQRVVEGNRVVQLRTTILGEREYANQIERHLMANTSDIVWTLDMSTITMYAAALITPGEKRVEAGQAYMQLDNVFEGGTGILIE